MFFSCFFLPIFCKKSSYIFDLIGIIIVYVVACIFTNYTDILGIFGGGGKLFGGTYLFLFYIGMLLSKYNVFMNTGIIKKTVFCLLGAGWCGLLILRVKGGYEVLEKYSLIPINTKGNNPPNFTTIISSILLVVLCFVVFYGMETFSTITKNFTLVLGRLGKHTLYIFLYHSLLLDKLLKPYCIFESKLLKWVVYFSVLIFGPILIENFFKCIKNWYVKECRIHEINN